MPLQGVREGLLEKLEAVLTRGKGSASGSRFAEEFSGKDLVGESVGVR